MNLSVTEQKLGRPFVPDRGANVGVEELGVRHSARLVGLWSSDVNLSVDGDSVLLHMHAPALEEHISHPKPGRLAPSKSGIRKEEDEGRLRRLRRE